MKFITKFKHKLVHMCGGIMPNELPEPRKQMQVIYANLPIQHLQVHFTRSIDDTLPCINDTAAHQLAIHIIDNNLMKHTNKINCDRNTITEYYDIWVGNPHSIA